MEKQEILENIANSIDNGNLSGLSKSLDLLLEVVTDEEASQQLSIILFERYTRYKADMLAKIMEIIIRKRPNLALLKKEENFLFRLVITSGSKDLYDCYIEEAIQPTMAKMKQDDQEMYYCGLFSVAEELTEKFFGNYIECVKGVDYNGSFGRYEKDNNVALIHQEDYETMNAIMENFNKMVGRRDILKDLSEKAGL